MKRGPRFTAKGKAKTKAGQSLWNEKALTYYKGLRADLIPATYNKDLICKSAAKNEETKLMLHLESLGYNTFGGRDREKRCAAKLAGKQRRRSVVAMVSGRVSAVLVPLKFLS